MNKENNSLRKKVIAFGSLESEMITEYFNLPENCEGKLVSFLHKLGFYRVFDLDFFADLYIIEIANELFEKIKNKESLPLIVADNKDRESILKKYPELKNRLSLVKGKNAFFEEVIKGYFAELENDKRGNYYTVSVSAIKDCECDEIISASELIEYIKENNIDLASMPNEEFDKPFNYSTGAGKISSLSGGLCEGILRTFYETATGKELKDFSLTCVRNLSELREISCNVGKENLKAIAAPNFESAEKALCKDCDCHLFVIDFAESREIKNAWADNIYKTDEKMKMRRAHDSVLLKITHNEFLGVPGGEKIRELLYIK